MNYSRPIRLIHNRIERPFKGGLLLDKLQNRSFPQDAYEAESWIGSTTEVIGNKKSDRYGLSRGIVENKEHVLKDLINKNLKDYLGERHIEKFGANTAMLIKLIDSYSRLLIQVHPTKDYAREFLNSEYGKSEAWHILQTRIIDEIEPHVYVGFKEGITREIWKELFEKQDINGMLGWLHKMPVKAGDTIWIPGGVPHAIGSGCLLVEIQEPTDYTMRVEKHRLDGTALDEGMLHHGLGIEKMLDCFKYEGYPMEKIAALHFLTSRESLITLANSEIKKVKVIDSSCTNLFSMNKYRIKGKVRLEKDNYFCIAVVVEGKGQIQYKEHTLSLVQGDEIFIPASNDTYEYQGSDMTVIECYPPSL